MYACAEGAGVGLDVGLGVAVAVAVGVADGDGVEEAGGVADGEGDGVGVGVGVPPAAIDRMVRARLARMRSVFRWVMDDFRPIIPAFDRNW